MWIDGGIHVILMVLNGWLVVKWMVIWVDGKAIIVAKRMAWMKFWREEMLRFGLLKRSVSEAVHSSEPLFARANPSQNACRLSQPHLRSSSPVPEQFAQRPYHRSSEPLTEPWSLEPPPFFARPFLTRSSPLERIPNSLKRTPSRELFAWATLVLRSTLPDSE